MGKSYDERKQQVATILRAQSREGRDIGPLPSVADAARRDSCQHDLKLFCEIYFAAAFYMGWSADHLRVIGLIQDAVLNGGLFAVAMPRGNGKTTLCVVAAIWAMLFGHCRFVVLIGATEAHAVKLMKNLMTHFETNELLLADFPEVVYPIRRLERISKRAAGQLLDGEPTMIGWSSKELILPTVPNSAASGARVAVAGITGAVRGLHATLSDGSIIRPDFCLIDDPQTKESASSPKMVADRLSIINGDVLGLAGPQKKISCVAPITVVEKGDVADQLLDRKTNPEWQGVKTKLLKFEPKNVKLWDQYAEVWSDSLRKEQGISGATEFYLANREELDDGAEASWPERFNPDEASAIQNAMNLKLRDPVVFAAEYQNEPLSIDDDQPLLLRVEQVAAKAVNIARGVLPDYSTKLTSFIDVQGNVLFYVVVAWAADFTGHVVDYGSYPEQKRGYFFLREVSPTLAQVKPNTSFEAYLRAGLDVLIGKLVTRKWQRQDGGQMSISRLVIDANWGDSTTVVKQACKESNYSALLLPSHGFGVTEERKPMNQYTTHPGERSGWNWRIEKEGHLRYDTNAWKTFVTQRLLMNAGEAGNMSLFTGSQQQHKMFADHVTAEYAIQTSGPYGQCNVWRLRPNRENHWLDCLIGAAVAASEQGIICTGHQPQEGLTPLRKRRKVSVKW